MPTFPDSRMHRLLFVVSFCLSFLTATGFAALPVTPARQFIAHRGVNLHSSIAGENSLEAIALAKRAGFSAIETDVRLSADGELVIMHDETLNRTCLRSDGTSLGEKVPVASRTLAELKTQFVLKATEPRLRTRIPSAREYFTECRKQGLLLFIEPKLNDSTGTHYRDILRLADEIMGPRNYVITSNNKANLVIRKIGIVDVPLMGVLYQTTFEEIAGLQNVIMAISTSRFSENDFAANVARSVAAKIPTESHADNFPRFALIESHKIDFVSTDLLAPDLKSGASPLVRLTRLDEFDSSGRIKDGALQLARREPLAPKNTLPKITFGGIYLDLEIQGECRITLGNQEFSLKHPTMKRARYQLMVYDSAPAFRLTATKDCLIQNIHLTLSEY